jgi:exopolysaccharide production protein ExoZ
MIDNRSTIPLIQAARGIAVVLVMLFHTSQLATKYFHINFLGISGMDRSGGYAYFFVLTGFLMYTLYHRHFGNARMWGAFMVKRLLRIYPLYWLVNAAVIPIYFLVPSFGNGYETKPSEIVTSLLLLPYSQVPILGVAWSLIYIMFFYMMFSLLFVLEKKTIITMLTLWLIIVGLTTQGWIHLKDGILLRFLFDWIHLAFLLGMLIAWSIRRFSIGKAWYWLTAGILVFPIVWVIRSMHPSFAYSNELYTLGSSLVLLGIGSMRTAASRWLRPAQFLGDASYSILLTSLPFLSITLKLSRAVHLDAWCSSIVATAICFLAALSLCCMFYWYIERPLVKRLKALSSTKTKVAPVR